MAIRLLSSESIDGALTLTGNLTGTSATFAGTILSNTQLKAITSSGGVSGYFTDAVNSTLQIKHASGQLQFLNGSNNIWLIEDGSKNTTFGGNVTVGNSGNIKIPTAASGNANLHFDGTDFKITSNSSSANLKLETSSTTRLTINSTGNATFAGNVYAPSLASSDTSGRYFMIQNAAGNQTYPVYSFRTDGNTGMMNPGADILSLVTGGTTRLTINNSSSTFAGNATFAGNGVEITSTEVIITPNIATSAFVLNGQSRKYKMLNYSNQFYIQDFTVNAPSSTTRFMINGDGDIGIATTNPQANLHINEDTSNSYATLRLEGANRGGIIEMYNQASYPVSSWTTDQSGNIFFATSGAFAGTSLSTKFTILTGGNVGINQTGPSFKLDVNGTGYFSDLLRVDEPVYSYTNSGTKHYTHLATGSLYGSGASAAIITTNIPGHNISGNGNMFSFKIVGYAYTMGIIDMTVGMYAGENNYYSVYWSGTCQDNWIGNVYVFTNSAGAVCIQLGEVTDVLNCEIAVTDFVQGFGNVNANYSKGWSIAAVTTLPTQNQKTALNYKTILPDVYEDVIFRNKVSIGATSPSANLTVSGPGAANDPVVAIDVTNSSAFNHGLEIFDANLTDGETVLMAIGKAGSTKNTAIFGYIHDADGGNNNLATIGFWGADNKMTVSAGGNVGIGTGTTTAEQKLHVEGRGIFDGGTSSDILQIRNDNGGGVFGMTSNLFALDLASTSAFRIRQGSSVPFYLSSDGNLGIGVTPESTSRLHVKYISGGNNCKMTLESNNSGDSFINYSAASNEMAAGFDTSAAKFVIAGGDNLSVPKFSVFQGSGNATLSGTLTQNSDITLKENIKPLESQLEIVSKLNPVSYNKIGFEENEVGFIAQEVEKFLPQLVCEDEKGIKSLAYGNMNAILVKAIQELKAEIEILKSK